MLSESTNEVKGIKQMNEQDRMQTAQTIINQLGGHKFVVMTGAKEIYATQSGVQFKVSGKDGINFVKVDLTSADLYDVTYARKTFSRKTLTASNVVKASSNGLYFDMIRADFESKTGLYTSL